MSSTTKGALLDADFVRRLEHLALVSRRVQVGVAKGERNSKRKGSSIEFADYRDYVQGDDLRHVDWNIVGRLDALFLKLFREQEDLTLHLLVDASESMRFGRPAKIDFARQMAAALGYIALVGYDRVCVEAFRGPDGVRLAPCRGKASAQKLFGFLEGIEPGGGTALDAACRTYVLRNRAPGVTVLISDFLDPAGFEGALRRLKMSRSDVYVIHVLSPDEVEPPVSGDLRLIDCETDTFTEITMSRGLLKRYKENLAAFCEALRRECLARDIGYIRTVTDTSFERVTLDVLRRRGMLK